MYLIKKSTTCPAQSYPHHYKSAKHSCQQDDMKEGKHQKGATLVTARGSG